jgi:hypothetical protein
MMSAYPCEVRAGPWFSRAYPALRNPDVATIDVDRPIRGDRRTAIESGPTRLFESGPSGWAVRSSRVSAHERLTILVSRERGSVRELRVRGMS